MTIEIVKEITRQHEEQYDGLIRMFPRGTFVRVVGADPSLTSGHPHNLGKRGYVLGYDKMFPSCLFVEFDDKSVGYFRHHELERCK